MNTFLKTSLFTLNRRYMSHSMAANLNFLSKSYLLPVEYLHDKINCPWWISIALVTGATQFICLYPLNRHLSHISKEQVEKIRDEKNEKHQCYIRTNSYNDVVLKKNSLLSYQMLKVKYLKHVCLFYLPQALFGAFYVGGFYTINKVITSPTSSFLTEQSWLVPALTHNYASNFLLDAINGIVFGAFGYLMNQKFLFFPLSSKGIVLFSSAIGIFSAISNVFLPGALKIHCAASLFSYLWIFS